MAAGCLLWNERLGAYGGTVIEKGMKMGTGTSDFKFLFKSEGVYPETDSVVAVRHLAFSCANHRNRRVRGVQPADRKLIVGGIFSAA
jgi:hypothetical protein